MKAETRKRIQQLLDSLPKGRKFSKLKSEFQRKGFLSKREIRELYGLKAGTLTPDIHSEK